MSEAATVHPPMTIEEHEQGIQAWCRAFLARAEAWRPCDGDIVRWAKKTLMVPERSGLFIPSMVCSNDEPVARKTVGGYCFQLTVEDEGCRIIFSSRDLGNGAAELHVQDFDHLGGELVPSVCQTLRHYLNPVPDEEPEVSE